MTSVKGRFAPSPTGRMHTGNIYAALMSWLSAKARGGSWLLRIEDLDPQRSRHEYARQLEEDLLWLGLEWDEGGLDNLGPAGPYVQSERGEIYTRYLDRLKEEGLVYPCYCTRSEIMATQAPHQSDGRVVYSGACRPVSLGGTFDAGQLPEGARIRSTRLSVPDEEIRFTDRLAGEQSFNLARDCGDFVVRRADGAWAYQLAVVVDDALMGVTEVVRGDDLLLSTAQQIYLYRLLGFDVPEFAHLPLITNEAGQRLSKRDQSESMAELRRNHTPESLIGRVAHLAGLRPTSAPLSLRDCLSAYADKYLPFTL